MTTHDKKNGMTLTLVEAVETLSNIADLEFDKDIGIAQQHDIVLNGKPLSYHTVHWLHHQEAGVTVSMVKETFRVILNYLQNFYKNDYNHITDTQAVEKIKTIMLLVGEAAKKLDKYTSLFLKANNQSVTGLKEYKQLQEFYFNRVAKKIDEGTIGKWILALARKEFTSKGVKLQGPKSQTKHVFMDLESVKKDTEYELFFLRKEDGTRFFSPRLIRNIKLVSDFGSYLGEEREHGIFLNIEAWQDKISNTCAKNILRSTRSYIEKFYRLAPQSKEQNVVELVNKALMALMMAGNSHLLNSHTEGKHCRDYFYDFQLFLRRCLKSSEYQRLIAYSSEKQGKVSHAVSNLLQFFCRALYTQLTGYQELLDDVHELILKATEKLSAEHKEVSKGGKKLWMKLSGDYNAMSKLLKGHSSGPFNKTLNSLEAGDCHQFDPIMHENWPSQLYTLYVQENRYQFARWPSPTYQEFIHKAGINEEFKGFLYGSAHHINRTLIFNFQDRVTWKEHSRCEVIEDLPNHESFAKYIEIVTLAKDTELYHQLSPYNQENRADVFIQNFKNELMDENCGFFFPKDLKKELMKNFVPDALKAIHRIFFAEKNVLLRENRLDFIEIFYLFLELKIIECVKPDIVGLSCKDGLDITSTVGVELFIFLKLINQERLSENDQEHLDLMLYGPSLISRERLLIPERFNRMLNALKVIESTREQFGQAGFAKIILEAFSHLYKTPILKGKVVVQNNKEIF